MKYFSAFAIRTLSGRNEAEAESPRETKIEFYLTFFFGKRRRKWFLYVSSNG
jgi:hypothetical protein